MKENVSSNLREIIKRLPKSDLHVHLDGSIRLETLIEISRKEKLDLPSFTGEGLNEILFKSRHENLEGYLETFAYSCAVMQKPEYLEQIAYEFALDNQNEGVRYVEVRFAPQLLVNRHQDLETVLERVNKGLSKAQQEFNHRPEVRCGQAPPFYYGLIACAMRNFGPVSDYYKTLIELLAHSEMLEIRKLASMELARAVVRIRDERAIPIVGFDLAGAETGYPAKEHWEAYQYAHESFMHKTVHAGEAYGPESIFQAITELHADRIGHGYYLFDSSKIRDPRIHDKERYISDLCQYIADRRISIEVCLSSNLQTNPTIGRVENHNFRKMLDNKLSTSLCTDNRTVSKTTVTDEICLAMEGFGLEKNSLKNCITYGFKRSFFPKSYLEKRQYVRRCIDYYEQLTEGIPELEA